MSQLESVPAETNTEAPFQLAVEPNGWLDEKLAWFSEFMSPILVKETRQAFKSRQFFWTFFLLLTATAVWSIMGYAIGVSEYNEPGQLLLTGYWFILGLPLLVIIPFTVYRSLASEYENNTIQLVSITTMKPRQIVFGKIGSAMLQMMVFFSVLAPCICFTYLLRGVDLAYIVFGLGISFFASLGLSMLGLFMAGVSKNAILRIGTSVILLLGLFLAYIGYMSLMAAVSEGTGMEADFLPSLMFGMCAGFFAIGFLAFSSATAQVSFPADNQSTMVRIAMLIFSAVAVSLFGLALVEGPPWQYVWVIHIVVCHIWMVFGFMMSGENPFMSPRVRRSLPQNFLPRSAISFLLPGPGRGYLFAFINLVGWTIALSVLSWIGDEYWNQSWRGPMTSSEHRKLQMGIITNLIYSSLFLSVTFLIIRFFQRSRTYVNPAGGFLIGILVWGFCLILALTLHFSLVQPAMVGNYSDWAVLNWYWSGIQWLEYGAPGSNVVGTIFLGMTALGFSVLSMAFASRELARKPVAIPQRVLQDMEEQRVDYVEPQETIDNIFESRKAERDS
jgi:hypothetical protein